MEAEDCAQNEPRGDSEGQKAPSNAPSNSAVDTVSCVLHVLTCQQTLLENAKRQLEAWNRGDVISVAELATEAKRFVAEAQGKRKAGETIKGWAPGDLHRQYVEKAMVELPWKAEYVVHDLGDQAGHGSNACLWLCVAAGWAYCVQSNIVYDDA